jgi:c-di-GMP-binding flagellar brake protein YcgR
MPFLNTAPADIDRLDPGGTWARFRVDDRRRILKSLQALSRGDAPVTVGVVGGPSFIAALWSVDEPASALHFSAGLSSAIPPPLMSASRLWAVAYDEEVKLQFELRRFVVEQAADRRLLHAVFPTSLYALPRRSEVRVKPAEPTLPTVRFRHPLAPERWTQMRALDLGRRGCALWRPLDALPLPPGLELAQAEVELDDNTCFFADLRVQHVTLPAAGGAAAGPQGVRVGCRWSAMAPAAEQALAGWVRSGQRRHETLSMNLDTRN